jgi:hypothetical protein
MPYSVWRFQADVKPGEANPVVTVFVGPERFILDDKGDPTTETYIEQVTADPVVMPLSQLAATLADPARIQSTRKPRAA